MKMFSIFDSKAQTYCTPFFSQTLGTALRDFAFAANDKTTNIGRYPSDFVLFELGEFCLNDGSVTLHTAHINHGFAIHYVEEVN